MFAYIDKVSDALVEEFGTERERLVRSTAQLRLETVRAILGGDPVDEEAASRRLGYDLRRHHVALRIAAAGSRVRGLERAVDEAAAALVTASRSWCPPAPRASTSGTARSSPSRATRSNATNLRGASLSRSAGPLSASSASAPRTLKRSKRPARRRSWTPRRPP
jgi:hypothetical protein